MNIANPKIVIIGNSGSGKTWLAHKLSQFYKTDIIHLDEIFWQPGGFDKKRTPQDIDTLIEKGKLKRSWITEGVFGELAEKFIEHATMLCWLDIPWNVCRQRLLARGSESKKHMNRNETEEGLRELIDWASTYYVRNDSKSFKGHKMLMRKFNGTKIRLQNENEVLNLIETL